MAQHPPLRTLQETIEGFAQAHWAGEYWPPHANLARLTEEVGEIARAVNQGYGPKRIKPDEAAANLATELSDALFALLCIANSTGTDLQSAFDAMLERYAQREG